MFCAYRISILAPMPPSASARTSTHAASVRNLEFTIDRLTTLTSTHHEPESFNVPKPMWRRLRFITVESLTAHSRAGWALVEFKMQEIKSSDVHDEWFPASKEEWDETLKAFSLRYPFVALAYTRAGGPAKDRDFIKPELAALRHVLARFRREDPRLTLYIWAEQLCTAAADRYPGHVPLTEDIAFRFARRVVVLPGGPRLLTGLNCSDGQVELHGSIDAQCGEALIRKFQTEHPIVFALYERSIQAEKTSSLSSSSSSYSSSAATAATATAPDRESILSTNASQRTEVALTPLLEATLKPDPSQNARFCLRFSLPGVHRSPPFSKEALKTMLRVQENWKSALRSATCAHHLISSLAANFGMESKSELEKARAGDDSVADRERQTLAVAEFLEEVMKQREGTEIPKNFFLGVIDGASAPPWRFLHILPYLPRDPSLSDTARTPLCILYKAESALWQRNDDRIEISFDKDASELRLEGVCLNTNIFYARAWQAFRLNPPPEKVPQGNKEGRSKEKDAHGVEDAVGEDSSADEQPSAAQESPPAEKDASTEYNPCPDGLIVELEVGWPDDRWRLRLNPSDPVADTTYRWYWIVYVGELVPYPPADNDVEGGKKTLRVMIAKDLGLNITEDPSTWVDELGGQPLSNGDRLVVFESWSCLEIDHPDEFVSETVPRRNFVIPEMHPTPEQLRSRIEK
ncbi:hypothetical protein C8T65DRAFT_760452 [Cerioporus squamosus]|nr:hypothetical protein C8T65DRAFT_760452 [Cerioporus squamosus]